MYSRVSFSLPVVAPAANATGGAIGKVTYGPLTIEALIDNQYLDLFHDAVDGTHFQTCQLIETVTGPSTPAGGGTVTYVWTFKTVYVGSVTAIGSDTANADSTGRNAQTGLMQVTFVFVSVTPTIGGAAA